MLRVEMFLRSGKFDKTRFLDILDKCQLRERFATWNLM